MLSAFLVEDSPTIRENLVPTLEELADVTVIAVAETESEAVEWLHTHGDEADLVILDLFLKQGSGLGVLTSGQLNTRCSIVVLTNYATSDIRQRCEALGADAVFDKSSELDAFLEFCRGQPVHDES